jgi:hypothetical protein
MADAPGVRKGCKLLPRCDVSSLEIMTRMSPLRPLSARTLFPNVPLLVVRDHAPKGALFTPNHLFRHENRVKSDESHTHAWQVSEIRDCGKRFLLTKVVLRIA